MLLTSICWNSWGAKMVGKITSDAKLTGHTAPVLTEESPYMSRNDLLAKILNAQGRGNYQTDTFSGNEATELGNDLEPFIIRKSVERLGFAAYDDEITEVYAFEDLFEVSLDGVIFNKTKVIHASDSIKLMNGQDSMTLEGDGVIESKLTSAPYTDVPPPYRGPRQLDMQMMCKGAKWGVIATLYQGTRLVLYVYEANQDRFDELIDAGKDFYRRLDGPEWYPAVDGVDAAKVHSDADDSLPPMDLEPVADLAMTYYDARRAAKAAEALAKSIEPKLMDALGNHESGILNDEFGNPLFEVKWPTRSFKAQPEKIVPAKPARVERQKSLTIPAKWLGDMA